MPQTFFYPSWLAVSLALLALAPASARAQTMINPYARQIGQVASPYWGYTSNPYATPLHGVAAVIRSQGEYLINTQNAALQREKVRVSKLETRKKELEQWEWERDFRAQAIKRQRERIQEEENERARKFPPVVEILAGTSLNNLLRQLSGQPATAADSVAVDPKWLAHIHLASAAGGNIGLLKSERIHWPFILRTGAFADERQHIERLLAQCRQNLGTSAGVSADDVQELGKQVASLARRADAATRSQEWSISDSVTVYRFLGEVKAALRLLQQPDVAFYLKPLEGRTVAEVMAYMRQNGLRFAPATVGTERFYMAFHRALAEEAQRRQATGSTGQ